METFQKAIAKAESAYGLVSAPDAVLIRWVQSAAKAKLHGFVSETKAAKMLRFGAGTLAVAHLSLCALMGSAGLFLLGYVSWYYGLGKRAPSGGAAQSFSAQDSTRFLSLYVQRDRMPKQRKRSASCSSSCLPNQS